ncbi:MAG TPA: hypothetical protein VGE14_15910 [Marmoricola sp.]
MSEHDPQPPGQPPYDPRAQAAAAKAYAKAQRPWYKKKRFIIPLAFLALVIIGSAAASGSEDKGSQAGDGPTDTPSAAVTNSQTEGPASETPEPAEEADNSSKGAGAITWGNWQVVGKIQVKKEQFTDDYSVITRVRNTGDEPDEGFFTVTMLKGEEILGTADCSTSTVQSGAIGTADCFSTDAFKPGWTEITIEDAF